MRPQDPGPVPPLPPDLDGSEQPKGLWDLSAPTQPKEPRRVGDPEHPLDDLWQTTTGLVGGVSDVIQGYADLINMNKPEKIEEWKKGWADLATGKYHKEVGGQLWKGLKEDLGSHWTDPEGNFSLGYTLYHHPASALMDLAVLKDMAAGGAKMTGKFAGGRSIAMMTADEVAKLGKLTRADQLVQLGDKVGKIPLDPYQLLGKAATKNPLSQWIKEELGFGPQTKELARIGAENAGEVDLEHFRKAQLLLDSKFGQGSGERIFNAMGRGSAADFAALSPKEHELVQRYWATQGLRSTLPAEMTKGLPAREEMLKLRGILGENTDEVLALQAGLREWGPDAWRADKVGKELVEQRMKYALDKIKEGEWTPTYYHLAVEKDHEYSLIENFMRDLRGEGPRPGVGGTSFLEQRKGTGKYLNDADPLGTMLGQMGMEAQFDRKVRFFDKALHHLQSVGELKIIDAAAAEAGNIPKGYAIVPHEIWKKYMLVERRAAGLAYAEAMKGVDAITAQRQAYAKLASEPGIMKDIADPKKIVVVPKYVANYLKFKLALPGPLARTYDKVMGYWKGLATVLRPTFWFNEAGGNGFLSALHGVSPSDAARYWKYRHLLPPELAAIPQLAGKVPGASRYQKVINTLGDWDRMLNTHMKNGPAFAHSVEAIRKEVQGTYKALADVGHQFFIAADVVDDPGKFYQLMAQSPEKLSVAIQEHVALREQIGSRIPKVVAAEAEYGQVSKELEEMKTKLSKMQGRNGWPPRWQDLDPVTGQQYRGLLNREIELKASIEGMKEEYLRLAEREGMVRKSMPELKRIADWAEKAVQETNTLGGGFNRLHPLERSWMTRVLPFYAWTKSMTKLTFMLPFIYPKTTFMWNRWSSMMQDLTSRDKQMPEYLQGAVHVGVTADGCDIYSKPIWNAFSGEQPGRLGNVTMPGLLADMAKQHPLLKVLHDLPGGVDSFTLKPWSTDETMTRTDTGEVYKLDVKTGKWKRTIAQPDVWRRLWSLFPLSQTVDTLFLPHVQEDKGWIGNPAPYKDPTGKPSYPVPMYQRFLRTVLPVTYQPKDAKEMRELKDVHNFKHWLKDIKKMDPEEQAVALQVLDDAYGPRKPNPYTPRPALPVSSGRRRTEAQAR